MNFPLSRVIVVDDRGDDAFVLSHLLEKAGLQVTPQIFSSGEIAVQYLSDAAARGDPLGVPTAVFSDVWLPGLNGFELLKWARRQPLLQSMAVILLSSSDEPRDLGKAARLGADCYFIKFPPPSAIRELLGEIQNSARIVPPRPAFPVACNLLAAVSA